MMADLLPVFSNPKFLMVPVKSPMSVQPLLKTTLEKIIDRIQEDHLALYHLLWVVGSFVSTAASLFTEKSGGIPSIPEEDGAGGAMGVSYKF